MKKKEQAVIEPLFNFFLSDAVTFCQISKLTILLKQKMRSIISFYVGTVIA